MKDIWYDWDLKIWIIDGIVESGRFAGRKISVVRRYLEIKNGN